MANPSSELTALESLHPGDVIFGNPKDYFNDLVYYGVLNKQSKARRLASAHNDTRPLIVIAVDKKEECVWTSLITTHGKSGSLVESPVHSDKHGLFAPIYPASEEGNVKGMRVLTPTIGENSDPSWACLLRKLKVFPDEKGKYLLNKDYKYSEDDAKWILSWTEKKGNKEIAKRNDEEASGSKHS